MTIEHTDERADGPGDADHHRALAPVADLLGDEAMWAGPPPLLFDEIRAAVVGAPVVELETHRPGRRRWWFAAAAAAVLVVGTAGYAIGRSGDDGGATTAADLLVAELDLVGTDLAPDARAAVDIFDRGAGYALLLDTTGLAPAPTDEYYQGWLRAGSGQEVSIGTFHMRSGDDIVVLWSGVPIADYPELVVTREREASAGPGETVLTGRWTPAQVDGPGGTVEA